MSRLLLLLFSVVSLLSAGVHTIRPEGRTHNYFYTLPHLLQRIPELQVRVFDATDQDIRRNGRSMLWHNAVQFCINGVAVARFQDGRQLPDLLPLLNERIDSLLVYTGADALQWGGTSHVVVDIIAAPLPKKSLGGTGYVGSEMGDPTVLLVVLDEENIPYNKEQFAAGELYGSLHWGRAAHGGGLKLIYMDRYSNMNEEIRAEFYPRRNSGLHMDEIRGGVYQLQHRGAASTSDLVLALSQYNLFRYDPAPNRYSYFEGLRGNLLLAQRYDGERFRAALHFGTMLEQAKLFADDDTFSQAYWGDLQWRVALGMQRFDELTFTVMGEQQLAESPLMARDSGSYETLSAPLSVQLKVQLWQHRLTTTVSLPLQLTAAATLPMEHGFTLSGVGAFSFRQDARESRKPTLLSELGLSKALNKLELYGRLGYDLEPYLTRRSEGARYGDLHGISWCEVGARVPTLGELSFYGSTYEMNTDLRLQKLFAGMTLGGGAQITSATAWRGGEQVPLGARGSDGVTTLPARLTADFFVNYALFDERVTLAMAVRDLGKVRVDIPGGCKVGPVMVCNIAVGI